MILNSHSADPISAEESTRHSWSEEENRLAREHDLTVRKMELETLKVQNRWDTLLKIPITIVKLPAYIFIAIGYIFSAARGTEPSDRFWRLFE